MRQEDYSYCRECIYCSSHVDGAASNATCEHLAMTGIPRINVCRKFGVGCTARKLYDDGEPQKARRNEIVLPGSAGSNATAKAVYNRIDKAVARKLYDEGKSDHAIAAHFGVSPSSVGFWRKSLNLPANYARGQKDGKAKGGTK